MVQGLPAAPSVLEGVREGCCGAGMLAGAVSDGIFDGTRVDDPDEESGCEGLDDEGGVEGFEVVGGFEGSGFDGGVVGSFVGVVLSLGFVGSGVVLGCVDSVVLGLGVPVEECVEGVGVVLDGLTCCWVSDARPEGDAPGTGVATSEVEAAESAAEAGTRPSEPATTKAPAMAAQRRAKCRFEHGFLERIRLLRWVKRQAAL